MTLLGTYYTYYEYTGTNNPHPFGDYRFYFQIYLDSQSISNNTSTIIIREYMQIVGSGFGLPNATTGTSINGGSFVSHSQGDKNWNVGTHLMGTRTVTIYHNSNGTGSFSFLGRGSGSSSGPWLYTANPTITLPTIPRYTTINSFSVSNNGLTSLKVSWSAANTCDLVQYSLNGGAWTTGQSGDRTSGTFYINDLTPGTTYSVKIRVRRKDSQLYTESSTKSATTADIARLVSVPDNINIDKPFTVTFNRNGATTVELGIYDTSGTTAFASYRTVTGTSYQFNLTETEKNALFNNMSNVNSKQFRIYIATNSNAYRAFTTKTFIVTNANPIFNNFTYKDTNATTVALTGNNQTIIKGYSNLRATISTSNKAVAQKGATMSRYQLVVGSKQTTANYSASASVNLDLNAIDNNVFTVYAIDSRGNSTAVQKSPATYIDYFEPYITSPIPTAIRTNGIGTETKLTFKGKFYNNNFGVKQNTITVTYQYKKTNVSTWTTGTTTLTPTINGNDFSFSGLIAGDLGANGFDQQYSYNIRLIISDELSSASYDLILGTGKPNLAIHREGIAINQPYDENLGGALQVSGDIKIDGENIKEKILSGLKKEKVNTSLSLGAGDSYQIPDFPDIRKILFMEIFLESAGNNSKGSSNFILPGTGFSYLVASSDLTGTYKGVYVNITNTGLIAVSTYRHGGVKVRGYRIIYLDI